MLETMSRRLNALPLTGLAIVALALLGPSSLAHADKVGVAAAVHPDAVSQGTEVKIGNSIFYNQRINTTGNGLVQVLLVDGSTFTVGPGSDLVIDKFVYDPNKNTGEVVATLGKGVLRFVGGKISKNEGGVTVNTPDGALAIRGGMFQGNVDGHHSVFSFLFGVEMKLTGADGQVHRVYEPGYTIDLSSGTPTIRPTRPEDTNFFMKALSGGGHVVVGGDKTGNQGGNQGNTGNTKSNTLASITSTASQTQSTSQIQTQENQANNTPPTPSRTSNGYAAGVFTQISTPPCKSPCQDSPVGVLSNASPDKVGISFNAAQAISSASIALDVTQDHGGGGGAIINFVGNNSNSASADPTSITVHNKDGSNNQLIQQNSGDNTATLTGSSELLCTKCDFLSWGTWAAQLNFKDSGGASTNFVHANGYWVAGTVIDDIVLPHDGSATYNGLAWGMVSTSLGDHNPLNPYAAKGDMTMVWDFNTRRGPLTISHFDTSIISGGLTFAGSMCAPGATECRTPVPPKGNLFSGTLTGQLPTSLVSTSLENANLPTSLTGSATGSFVSGPSNLDSKGSPIPQSIPQGVIGNWNVGNKVYGASGIFGGAGGPTIKLTP
jgi:hypothetical protein